MTQFPNPYVRTNLPVVYHYFLVCRVAFKRFFLLSNLQLFLSHRKMLGYLSSQVIPQKDIIIQLWTSAGHYKLPPVVGSSTQGTSHSQSHLIILYREHQDENMSQEKLKKGQSQEKKALREQGTKG